MVSIRTRLLLATATLFSALLTGGIVDRALVGVPAWRALGPDVWARYGTHADLGRGLVAYPTEAIGATLLIIGAIVSLRVDQPLRRNIAIPLYLAAVFSVIGLLITIKAAPIMLSLGTEQSGSSALAFAEFNYWGLYLRGAADLLALVCETWALATVGGLEARMVARDASR
jgi:hypothetical protein